MLRKMWIGAVFVLTFVLEYVWDALSPVLVAGVSIFGVIYGQKIVWDHSGHLSRTGSVFAACAFIATGAALAKEVVDKRLGRGKFAKGDFSERYSEALSCAVETIQDVSGYGVSQFNKCVPAILKVIVSIVELCWKQHGVEVHANVMIDLPVDFVEASEFHRRVQFTHEFDVPQKVYAKILKIEWWEGKDHGCPDDFILPISRDKDQLLFGAPRAFVLGKHQYISDSAAMTTTSIFIRDQQSCVKRAIVQYMALAPFKSFVSIPLAFGDTVIGVLNIQSNQTHILGLGSKREKEILNYVRPFASLLAYVLVQRQKDLARKADDQP